MKTKKLNFINFILAISLFLGITMFTYQNPNHEEIGILFIFLALSAGGTIMSLIVTLKSLQD